MNHVIPLPCDFQLVANSRSFLNLNLVEETFILRERRIFFSLSAGSNGSRRKLKLRKAIFSWSEGNRREDNDICYR